MLSRAFNLILPRSLRSSRHIPLFTYRRYLLSVTVVLLTTSLHINWFCHGPAQSINVLSTFQSLERYSLRHHRRSLSLKFVPNALSSKRLSSKAGTSLSHGFPIFFIPRACSYALPRHISTKVLHRLATGLFDHPSLVLASPSSTRCFLSSDCLRYFGTEKVYTASFHKQTLFVLSTLFSFRTESLRKHLCKTFIAFSAFCIPPFSPEPSI